jgi:opacity protein-like surface antigen
LGAALVLGASLVVFSARARAETPVLVSLDYQADPALGECPSGADFERQIVRQLGRDPFRENAPRRLVVRLFASAGRLGGRVEWRDANDEWEGERTFASRRESCSDMARAMALATAIQIQLLAISDKGAPRPPLEPKPPVPPPVEARPPAPPPAVVVAPRPASPRESFVAVDVGAGVVQDFGDSPALVLPGLAVTLGRPSALGVRLSAAGFGPGAQVVRSEGSAQIERFVMTVEAIRFFRAGRLVQPLVTAGVGWQEVSAQGTSATPSVAAHDAHAVTALAVAGGGLAFALTSRLAAVVEAEALLFRPAVNVQIGSSEAAHLDGATLFVHGGLLARF